MATTTILSAERAMERCQCDPQDWVGRVATHDGIPPAGEPHASTWVCSLASHRSAAEDWVLLTTGVKASFFPKQNRPSGGVPND